MSETLALLDRLISFDTTSYKSNLDLMNFVRDQLAAVGVESQLIHNADRTKANLLACIGPLDREGGFMLSGHTDVVPVTGQNWSRPAFKMTCDQGKAFGRGTCDMKGFVASALAASLAASRRDLKKPLYLAFSYDEEVGCQGVRSLIDVLETCPVKPAFCLVGEPTSLKVATGHKGKIAITANVKGRTGHSALAPLAVNALHLACDLVQEIRRLQDWIRKEGVKDPAYDVPYTTLHVGRIKGGEALNIVPDTCEVQFEIRNLAEDNPQTLFEMIKNKAQKIVADARQIAPEAHIDFSTAFSYPGLNTDPQSPVVSLMKNLTSRSELIKVAFGTEGGLFDQRLAIPTVVCGPGSMDQGHKPDEFIELDQLALCDSMLASLLDQFDH